MTGQLPLAIAKLLIKCISALGATSDDDATAVTPILYQPRLRESTGSYPHSRTYRQRRLPRLPSLGSPVPASHAAARARAGDPQRGAPRWGHLVGGTSLGAPRTSVPSQQVGFRGVRSGSCARAWEGGGGRAARRPRSRRPSSKSTS